MDIIQALLGTVDLVKSTIEANKEVFIEISELGETVQLITAAIRPISQLPVAPSADLVSVFSALQKCLNDANKCLERISTMKKKGGWGGFSFRPQKELDELKGAQERLKTLVPILTLAISSLSALAASASSNGSQQASRSSSVSSGGSAESVVQLLPHQTDRDFWLRHFGRLYEVPWDRFAKAVQHELDSNPDTTLLKHILRAAATVDIYQIAKFTKEKPLLERLKMDIKDVETRKRAAENCAETNVASQKSSRRSPLRIEEPVRSTACILSLFGSKIDSMAAFPPDVRLFKLHWKLGSALTVGRAMFPRASKELLVRISRAHFSVECRLGKHATSHQFVLLDSSGNGTYVNDKLIGKNNVLVLEDGDSVTVLRGDEGVELGYQVSIKQSNEPSLDLHKSVELTEKKAS